MEAYQQRVVDEASELNDRLLKLRQFFESKAFVGVKLEEAVRMRRQEVAMASYLGILEERILAFPK